jgi:hypothetical protein
MLAMVERFVSTRGRRYKEKTSSKQWAKWAKNSNAQFTFFFKIYYE